MENAIKWLRRIEGLACDLYAEAAECFLEDKTLSRFLSDLSEDEAWHYHLIGSAADIIASSEDFPPLAVTIGEDTVKGVEVSLRSCKDKAVSCDIKKKDVIRCIVDTEFSEWNDIFMYVISTCQNQSRAFQRVAATVQVHKKKIAAFMDNLPPDLLPERHVQELPSVWDHKYLVVDDDQPTRELFHAFLSRSADVVTAGNGKEALDKLQESFFDIVVSDINMPVIDGVELFRRAVALDPEIKRRFVFCSGNVTSEVSALCSRNELALLKKPVMLSELLSAIERQILTTSAEPTDSGDA